MILAQSKTTGIDRLIIVTPQADAIRREFGIGFRDFWRARTGREIDLEWQERGGTVEIVQYLTSTFSTVPAGAAAEGIGIDVIFGGGVPAMTELKKAGCLQPIDIDPTILATVPRELNGMQLIDPESYWVGDVLSTHGIIYNKAGLRAAGLPEPKTWSDLAAPAFRDRVALADPSKSGSVRDCIEVILQHHGWKDGWALLMDIAGNAPNVASASTGVTTAVVQGDALAGLCIDFIG